MKEWEEKLIEEIEDSIIGATPDKYVIQGYVSVPLYYLTTIMDAIKKVFEEVEENV